MSPGLPGRAPRTFQVYADIQEASFARQAKEASLLYLFVPYGIILFSRCRRRKTKWKRK